MPVEGVVRQARRRRRCRRPGAGTSVPQPAHDLEAGVEQAPDLGGVVRAPAGQRLLGDRARPRRRSELGSACIQNRYSAADQRGTQWRGTSRPSPSSRRSWTGSTTFVREEVEPLDLLWPGLAVHPAGRRRGARSIDPLKQQVRAPGPVGHPPRARARRPGLRPAEAGAAERDPRPVAVGADRLRLPGARHRQRRDHRPLRHRRAEGALPPAAARRRDASPATR